MKYGIACLVFVAVVVLGIGAWSWKDGRDELFGRWDYCKPDAGAPEHFIEFSRDGGFRAVYPEKETEEGRFRVLPGSLIEFTFPEPDQSRTVYESKFYLEGDLLDVKVRGEWMKYKKGR